MRDGTSDIVLVLGPWTGATVLVLMIAMTGCASPVQGLWPPRSEADSRIIHVSLDTWHGMIAFPHVSKEPAGPRFEEWGYAEQAWYLEGRQGVGGVLRALFWPSTGVVEIGRYHRVWAQRTPQPPADLFSYRLSERGYRRLRRFLRATMAESTPLAESRQAAFFPATRPYHVFNHCHQYVARALQEAGLPVSEALAMTRSTLAWQLQRAVEIQDEHLAEPPSPVQSSSRPYGTASSSLFGETLGYDESRGAHDTKAIDAPPLRLTPSSVETGNREP